MSAQKIAVLFPGQGSQFVGMGKEFIESDDESARLMDVAESITNVPLKKLCLEGPMEELTKAHNLQPALTATSLLIWKAVQEAGIQADFFAGHSLGEYSALCAAGVLSFEDTLKLVTERGRLMGRAGDANPGGMCAVLGLAIDEVHDILAEVNRPDGISIGNHNSEQQVVLSGDHGVIRKAAGLAEKRGAKIIFLNVSIANHSPLMEAAVPLFEEAMAGIRFDKPKTPILFNVTGALESDPGKIREIMAAQVKSMVRWFDIINELLAREVTVFIEVGPKKVLTGLMKRIVPKDRNCMFCQVDSPEGLAKLISSLGALS
jgi:[acyl-carrier-protein] S-malonyltransferase